VNAAPGGGGATSSVTGDDPGWKPLYKRDFKNFLEMSGKCQDCTDNQIGEEFETIFENFVRNSNKDWYLGLGPNFRRGSKLEGPDLNTVPDFMADVFVRGKGPLGGLFLERIPGATIYECKAMYGNLYMNDDTKQIRAHAFNPANKFRFKIANYKNATPPFKPQMYVITTADVNLSRRLRAYIYKYVYFSHLQAEYNNTGGLWRFRFVQTFY
jgi:hypothetical protein